MPKEKITSRLFVKTYDKDGNKQEEGELHITADNNIAYADSIWDEFIGRGHNSFFDYLVQIKRWSFKVKRL